MLPAVSRATIQTPILNPFLTRWRLLAQTDMLRCSMRPSRSHTLRQALRQAHSAAATRARPLFSSRQDGLLVSSSRNAPSSSWKQEQRRDASNGPNQERRRVRTRRRQPSLVEERVALAEYPRMLQRTDSRDEWNKLLPSAKKQVLLYWMSKPVQKMVATQKRQQDYSTGASEDLPWERATRILDWILEDGERNGQHDLVAYLLGNVGTARGGSANEIITRMISMALQPMQGSVKASDGGTTTGAANQSTMLQALVRATSLVDKMQALHANALSPMEADEESCESVLNLWYKRARFLSIQKRRRLFNNQSDERTVAALGGASSARDCVEAMRRVIADMESPDCPLPQPDTRCYNLLILTLALCSEPTAAREAKEVLDQMSKRHGHSSFVYNSVLSAYANQAIVGNDPQEAKTRALDFLEEIQQLRDPAIAYEPVNYSTILNMLSLVGTAAETQAFLDDLERRASQLGRTLTNRVHYNIAITAWAKSGSPHASDRAAALFDRMIAGDRPELTPDRITYVNLMAATAKTTSVSEWLQRTDRFLDSMEKVDSSSGGSRRGTAHADAGVYVAALRGVLRRLTQQVDTPMRESLAQKAQDIVQRMHEQSLLSDRVASPDIFVYNIVLKCWALSHVSSALARALGLLDELDGRCLSGEKNVCPNSESYEWVMKCVAKRGVKNPVRQAKALMERMSETGNPKTVPVVNQYLRVLAKSGSLEEAESLVDKMETDYREGNSNLRPDEGTYRALMEGHAKKGEASKAQKILDRLKESGITPSESTYTVVLEAWGESDDPQAVDYATAVFDEVRQHYAPVRYTYTAYQFVWSRSRREEAPVEVESILQHMQQDSATGARCRPNANNFAVAIHCWASSRLEGALERAEAILIHMLDLCKTSEYRYLTPSLSCYSGVLLACARSGQPDSGSRAVAWLERLEAKADLSNPAVASCYVRAIEAVGRSQEPGMAETAYSIWKRLLSRSVELDKLAHVCRLLFKACNVEARSGNQNASHAVATRALNDFLQSSKSGTMGLDNKVFHDYLQTTELLVSTPEARGAIVHLSLSSWPAKVLGSTAVQAKLEQLSPETYRNTVNTLDVAE